MSPSLQLNNTALYLDPDLIRELLSQLLGLECFAELRRVSFFFLLRLLPSPHLPPSASLSANRLLWSESQIAKTGKFLDYI